LLGVSAATIGELHKPDLAAIYPHLADCGSQMADLVLANLAAHFVGREPVTPVV
jgi:hypothetical protein